MTGVRGKILQTIVVMVEFRYYVNNVIILGKTKTGKESIMNQVYIYI